MTNTARPTRPVSGSLVVRTRLRAGIANVSLEAGARAPRNGFSEVSGLTRE